VKSLTWLLLEPRSPHSRKPALSVIPELRLRQIPELRRFLILRTSPVPTYPKTNSKSTNRSLIRLSFSRIIRRSARCMWFIRISSRMSRSCETELPTLKVTHEFIYKFGKSDVSRVWGFCPIPQHAPWAPSCSAAPSRSRATSGYFVWIQSSPNPFFQPSQPIHP
jgi:hypothetical protein